MRLNIGRKHDISLDTAENAVFLHPYNAGNISSFILKTFATRLMRYNATLFLLYVVRYLCSVKLVGKQGVFSSFAVQRVVEHVYIPIPLSTPSNAHFNLFQLSNIINMT